MCLFADQAALEGTRKTAMDFADRLGQLAQSFPEKRCLYHVAREEPGKDEFNAFYSSPTFCLIDIQKQVGGQTLGKSHNSIETRCRMREDTRASFGRVSLQMHNEANLSYYIGLEFCMGFLGQPVHKRHDIARLVAWREERALFEDAGSCAEEGDRWYTLWMQ